MSKPSYVYVTYIETTAEKIWQALTDGELTRRFWGGVSSESPAWENVSDWKPGSRWHQRQVGDVKTIGVVGEVLESVPPRRLVLSWARPINASKSELTSRVTFEIEPQANRLVKLTVLHEELDLEMQRSVSGGWPMVLSNLKTLLETGHPLVQGR